ncbi:flippase-like domain-containing protein [Brachybacterium sp. Marseille-Q2903]|uniref:Flippase-like domain-containing protein n=1 Tax=Brachybacterium epidermidis TaxID=2781983 RepID=A0ABR9W014_9MICO|nr:lysylphosphatidylglycerol synthase domain-containing protein [Brachybacterium epidermidis]MBE9403762.1 flippase-like domain-containing protein [Brachybacterium epidermidis]
MPDPGDRDADHRPSPAPASSVHPVVEPSSAPPWQAIAPGLTVDRPPELSGKRITLAVLSLLLVAALLWWGLPWAAGASWPQILDSLAGLPAWAVPTMLLLGLGALALEAWTVRTAVPGSSYRTVLQGHAAASAMALAIPGGGMLGMGLLGWILRRTGLALSVVITGIVAASLVEMLVTTVLVPLLGGIAYVAAGMVTDARIDLPGAALWAALAAVVGAVVALVLAAALLRERPVALVGPTALARVLQWLALVLAIEAVGGSVHLLLTVAIFALGRVLSLVPLTPGGAGITETVGAAALVGLGLGAAASASAMLLLAITTLVVPLVAGGIAAATAVSRTGPRSPA